MYRSALSRVASKKLDTKIKMVNTMVINIKPIVLGSFKNFTFINPKSAAKKIKIVAIVNKSIVAKMFLDTNA